MSRSRWSVQLVFAAAVALVATGAFAGSASAVVAPAGSTFLTGGLALPPGGLAAGASSRLSPHNGSEDVRQRASVSRDGRFVAFTSQVDTFDPAARPDLVNVFRKDRRTGEVVFVSRATGAAGAAPTHDSVQPVISSDGMRVAFSTEARLDPADGDSRTDVYVRDLSTNQTLFATVGNPGRPVTDEIRFDFSGDGRFVVFDTAAGLVGEDGNGNSDVYRRDLTIAPSLAGTTLVSVEVFGLAAAGGSLNASISDEGRFVAFESFADDLVLPVQPISRQIFVRDVVAGRTSLVSAKEGTTTASNAVAEAADVTAVFDGASFTVFVAYVSRASDIVTGVPANAGTNVFLAALGSVGSRTSTLISVGGDTGLPPLRSEDPMLDDSGTRVLFHSRRGGLAAPHPDAGVFLRDVRGPADGHRTVRVAGPELWSGLPAISGDGSFLAWSSLNGETGDSDPDLSGVFGRPYGAVGEQGAPELVSRPAGGVPFLASAYSVNRFSDHVKQLSDDGRYMVFASSSARLPGGRRGGPLQVYRRDLLTGEVVLVSQSSGGVPGDDDSSTGSISADGTRVAFTSESLNFDTSHPESRQVYLRDLAAGTTTLVSRAAGPGPAASSQAFLPRLSPDGAFVAFVAEADNFGVADGRPHVYLRDLERATTTLVDRATGQGPVAEFAFIFGADVSDGGRSVAFATDADNIHPDDADGFVDVYVRDMSGSGTTVLVSRRSSVNGQPGAASNGHAFDPAISADGSVVAFRATDSSLAPEAGDWGDTLQVVARTLATGVNVLVSRQPGGGPANADTAPPSVSRDGSVVAFASSATNLAPGAAGGVRAYARARGGALSASPGFPDLSVPSLSGDGECVTFHGSGHNAVTGTAGDIETTYTHVVSGDCPVPPLTIGPPPGSPPPPRAGVARPVISGASLSRARFAVSARATARVAARKKLRVPPAGTSVRFSLNAAAQVSIAVQRKASGRKVGRRCRRPSRKLRGRRACTRLVAVGTLTRNGVRAGARSVAFSGRIGRRALRRGGYRLVLIARNEAGTSRPVPLAFRVVKASPRRASRAGPPSGVRRLVGGDVIAHLPGRHPAA